MSVIPKEVHLTGTVVDGKVTGQAGGAGVGFRVEQHTTVAYPPGQWPVTVRAYSDPTTYVDHPMAEEGARYLNEGFTKLELLGPPNTLWRVTLYETHDDRDERDGLGLQTFRDASAGTGGAVLKVVPALAPLDDVGAELPGTRVLRCTAVGTPMLAESSTGSPRVLKLDSSGRLRVVDEGTMQSLAADTLTKESGLTVAGELLGPHMDVTGYSTLSLVLGVVSLTGGTNPSATPALRSVATADLVGGSVSDVLELHTFDGNAVQAGQVGEVQVHDGYVNTAAMTRLRRHDGRILRVQCVVKFTGNPTGAVVKWRLYGEK